MKKATKKIISLLCAAMMLSSAANAMELDYFGENTSIFNEGRMKLHFTGKADGQGSNRMATIFVMKPGKTLEDSSDPENVAYMKTVSVDFDGNFEYEFGFDNDSGEYPVYVLVDDKNKLEEAYSYRNRDDIKAFFDKIRNETVQYSDVEDCAEALGLDLSPVTKEAYKDTVIIRIKGKKNDIKDENAGVDIIKNTLKDCAAEFKELEIIKNAAHWTEIPNALKNITSLTGVVYDYKGVSEQTVCEKLIDLEFTSAELLKVKFDELVANPTPTVAPGIGTGGGSKGNYGGSVGGAPIPTKAPSDSNAFSDIAAVDWAIKPINYLYSKGMINGTGNGEFSPNASIKREEVVKIIINAFGLVDDEATVDFVDTNSSMWHYKFIASAKAKGIVNGISETRFGVGENVTRQDLAVMIYNAAVVAGKGYTKTKTDFSDWTDVADYAQTAVSNLAGSGVISGMGDGRFAPKDCATRAQAAKIIYEVIQ